METIKIGDICSFENGDRGENYPSRKDYVDDGIPFVNSGNILNGKIEDIDLNYITEEKFNRLRAGKASRGDFVFTLRGSLGKNAVVEFDKCAIASMLVIMRPDESKIDKLFFRYAMNSPWLEKQVKNIDNGSIQGNLGVSNVKDFFIPYPNMVEQKKIASILASLDEKISTNNMIIETSEKLMHEIYDYWFVQFDFPDEEGRPYKSSGGKMIHDDILNREIPDDWKITAIKDVISHINTGLNPRQNFVLNNGDIKYITVKNLTTKGTIDFTTCDTIDKDALKKVHKRSDISKGDILFASIAPLGRCVIIREDPSDWDINESVFSIRPKNASLSEYLYMFFMSEAFIKKAEQSSTGSVFSGIRISVLEDMKVVVPPECVLDKFNKVISPILDLKYQNEIENQQLKEIRDFLLPLLMNGQIRIDN